MFQAIVGYFLSQVTEQPSPFLWLSCSSAGDLHTMRLFSPTGQWLSTSPWCQPRGDDWQWGNRYLKVGRFDGFPFSKTKPYGNTAFAQEEACQVRKGMPETVMKKHPQTPGLPVCTSPTDCCSNLAEASLLFRRPQRQNYSLLWWSLVKNGCVTAVCSGPNNVKLNLLSSWWLR